MNKECCGCMVLLTLIWYVMCSCSNCYCIVFICSTYVLCVIVGTLTSFGLPSVGNLLSLS